MRGLAVIAMLGALALPGLADAGAVQALSVAWSKQSQAYEAILTAGEKPLCIVPSAWEKEGPIGWPTSLDRGAMGYTVPPGGKFYITVEPESAAPSRAGKAAIQRRLAALISASDCEQFGSQGDWMIAGEILT